jgi:hypothetical protein
MAGHAREYVVDLLGGGSRVDVDLDVDVYGRLMRLPKGRRWPGDRGLRRGGDGRAGRS